MTYPAGAASTTVNSTFMPSRKLARKASRSLSTNTVASRGSTAVIRLTAINPWGSWKKANAY